MSKIRGWVARWLPWLRPLAIVAGAVFLFSTGWLSGTTGEFVKRLTEAVSVKREVEANLDQAMRKLKEKEQEAMSHVVERINPQSVIDAIRRPVSKPAAAPVSKPKPKPASRIVPSTKPKPRHRPRVAVRPAARSASMVKAKAKRATSRAPSPMRWELMTIPDPGPKSNVVIRRVCDHPFGGRCR